MKAAHINPQGRLKPYSLLSDQSVLPAVSGAHVSNTASNTYDLVEANGDALHLKTWKTEGGASPLHGFEHVIYDDFLLTLWDSPTARSLINFAAQHDWSIKTDALEDAAYDLEIEQRILTLNHHNLRLAIFEKPGFFRQSVLIALIKGLRDIWHIECRQPYEDGLSIESILFLERVRCADCDIISLLTAWELRGEGAPEIWRHLIGTAEGDLAMRFSQALESHPVKNFDGTALIEAFYEWFESPARIAACDHQTLEMIDGILDEDSAAARTLYGSRRPQAKFIESLSRLPDKKHYLSGMGAHLLNNPHFSGLDDDVNQAHFLQIRRELNSTTAGGVSFRDATLAAKIFPEEA